MKRILLVGCGYVASTLAARLHARGIAIAAVVRSERSAAALATCGIAARVADCRDPADARRACEGAFDAVVFSLSAGGGDYRAVYVDAFRNVLDAIGKTPPPFFASTGSTSVYGHSDGEWVAEDSPPEPSTPNAKVLLEAEHLLANRSTGSFPAAIVRFSGIYGPNRSHLLDLLRNGAMVLPGRPNAWMNRVHRDDAASALEHLLLHPPTAPGCEIFNATDDEPARQGDVVAWLCGKLGRALPHFNETAPPPRHGASPGTNRRISNAHLRATGWKPAFPSYREGFSLHFSPFSNK
ncbi:MAG: SDR family oxidoreductase [Verrucomicrobiia bacterium]